MKIISFEEFKNTDLYDDFIKENSSLGSLKVEVFTAYGAIPVANTAILVSKDIEEYKVVFFRGVTDSSGMISNIKLPAPPMVSSSEKMPIYTIYDMTAVNEGYEALKTFSIGMFGGVNVIQYVKLQPEIYLEMGDVNGN